MIRRYRQDDLRQVLDTWEASARDAYWFLDETFFAAERRAIEQQFIPASETWVFEHEGTVLGFISVRGREVGGLFVAPGSQRRGVGRALMDHVRGSRPRLEVSVFKENARGRAFYARYGFRSVGEQVNAEVGRVEIRMEIGTGEDEGSGPSAE